MRHPIAEELLSDFRLELDQLDRRIVELLSERLRVCRAVADCKIQHRIPMMQPNRIQTVKERVTAAARERGINEDFVSGIYDLIIQESCRIELEIMEQPKG